MIFKKKYTNKRELEIDLFFKYVNWYKLLKSWSLFPTYALASDTILIFKQNTELIKTLWKDNPNKSLPQILALYGNLPFKHIRKTGSNFEWYFSSISELMETMNIPQGLYDIEFINEWPWGTKRKQPIWRVKK